MADLLPILETLEHRWMRAWVARDVRALKGLTSRKFRMVFASKPCVILDGPSWLQAAAERYQCSSYRFGDIYAHDLGPAAVFATRIDLKATMDGKDWSGQVWVTDLWRKTGVRRNWRMLQRVVSRPDDNAQVPAAVRTLQLWR